MNALSFASGLLIGCLVGEYYRRTIDKIRREQIDDLKHAAKPATVDMIERPKPRTARPLVSEAQHAELRATGHTAGRYAGGVSA